MSVLNKFLPIIVRSKNERQLKQYGTVVAKINDIEECFTLLSDDDIKNKTTQFRHRLSDGETINRLLPEAFAVVREASKRTLGLRHFDVQLIGGIALHEGKISEMRTGEGKTLVATLPIYLNALAGKGVHVVTVNDYLAERDANWMRPIYEFLGLRVGVVLSQQTADEKRHAYSADITYGTNNEYGFDYLRDNMALHVEDRVQRSLHFAIVDEVDSILIDEARTPLVISGVAEDSSVLYQHINTLIPLLKAQKEAEDGKILSPGHYVVDEKTRQVELNEQGHEKIEELLAKEDLIQDGESLYGTSNLSLLHHIHSALRAHALYQKDVNYIVEDQQVLLIDEHTGRSMPGRRLSEGLHQAIEAKEGVKIKKETHTVASTTFQNYFRLYDKLAGMTGTADTEAPEFRQIYGLDVVVIPTNVRVKRIDHNDLVYLTTEEKYQAAIEDIKRCQQNNAPVLVGVGSIDTSEEVSRRLRKAGIKHKVLNAKFHEKEADIIAEAGRPGRVTIATNMAGRGTDIVLGGKLQSEIEKMENPSQSQIDDIKADWKIRHSQVIAAGGLHIICTERNESRRIDNQFRGRAGRQGDPGVSRFYLSTEDSLLRIFMSDRMRGFVKALGLKEGEAIEHKLVSHAIEKSQSKVEGRNFDIRKQLLEYDDIANNQRQIVYQQRNELLESPEISQSISEIRKDVLADTISKFIPPQSMEEQWDSSGLEKRLLMEFGQQLPVKEWIDQDYTLDEAGIHKLVLTKVQEAYNEKCDRFGGSIKLIEKQIMLRVLDNQWKEHLASMDHLRQGIGLRVYAQKNPQQEYRRESFTLFQTMLKNIQNDVIRLLANIEPMTNEEVEASQLRQREAQKRQNLQLMHKKAEIFNQQNDEIGEASSASSHSPFVRDGAKVGRNEPCPCDSGKKFKQCHGKVA